MWKSDNRNLFFNKTKVRLSSQKTVLPCRYGMSRFGEHRGFGRGRPRDERTRETGRFGSTSSTLFVPSQDCGKIIGKFQFVFSEAVIKLSASLYLRRGFLLSHLYPPPYVRCKSYSTMCTSAPFSHQRSLRPRQTSSESEHLPQVIVLIHVHKFYSFDDTCSQEICSPDKCSQDVRSQH